MTEALSLVCSIGYHDKCDGGAPNGPARKGLCACRCHALDSEST